jgi:predicted O-linked N-acetylglucosamine transferase (SPINDLY family)
MRNWGALFQLTINRKQKTENRKQKTENRKQKTENRKQKTENRKCRFGIISSKSAFFVYCSQLIVH